MIKETFKIYDAVKLEDGWFIRGNFKREEKVKKYTLDEAYIKAKTDDDFKIQSMIKFEYEDYRYGESYTNIPTLEEFESMLKKQRTKLFFHWQQMMGEMNKEKTYYEISGEYYEFDTDKMKRISSDAWEKYEEERNRKQIKRAEVWKKYKDLYQQEVDELKLEDDIRERTI